MATAGEFEEAACFDGLGQKWQIADNSLKPYACGVIGHCIIDAAIELRQHFSSADEIDRIEIVTNPNVLAIMGMTDPRDGLESKFSAFHCAAVGFLDGHGGPKQFSDHYAVAPHVRALRRRVHIEVTPEVRFGGAIVTAHGVDGRIIRLERDSIRVMTQSGLEGKVRNLAGDRI
jgi:2-methylcitrate dehydratase PrpD